MLDLFAEEEQEIQTHPMDAEMDDEEVIERGKNRIRKVLLAGHPAVLAFSSGKDSTVLVALALNAAREIVEEGHACPPLIVLHGDTGIEQPEVSRLAKAEIQKMEAYAKKHQVPLTTRITSPTLNTTFPVRVIGGRGLPAFPDSRADCSTDYKCLPNQRAQKEIISEYEGMGIWKQPVVMTGVRKDESVARDQRIAKRGEKADEIWRNDLGALRLTPLLDYTVDDIWTVIGLCHAGVVPSYSDFAGTMEVYRAGGGDSCVIVADMKSAANSKPCGTRTGCWACTRVGEDRSMAQMIISDEERYGYLEPLARLRDFISRTQYDWSLRHFVGRTIDEDGFITIGADTYSPAMLQRLLRYTLSAQVVSGVKIISIPQLIAIDARWSQYAFAPPFTALKIYFEVMDGRIELAPEVQRFPKTPVPRIGKIHVGATSYNGAMKGVSGLRNVSAEMFHEGCGFSLKSLKDGTLVLDVETDDDITVDEMGSGDFLAFIADEMIEDYCHPHCSDWTWGFKTYLQYGTIQVAKGKLAQVHEILQRAQWRQENDLHGQRDPVSLERRCDVLFSTQLELI